MCKGGIFAGLSVKVSRDKKSSRARVGFMCKVGMF
jgi:hypothetical protein